ncbi:MAG: 4'-phosphopantetheinyl transferase superfamily protein, partial [Clostridia bacterium]|nr:4'-phosphopantetheinyl transferase superfamily protein [Clostridia bacterium]
MSKTAKIATQVFVLRTDNGDYPCSALVDAARCFAASLGLDFPHDPVLACEEHGKPYFAALPGLHFSLSHSGEYWLAAFAAAPLGIDIQRHQSCRKEAVAERFFHPEEAAWLRRRGYTDEDFFALWTAKESYVKYTGQGIDESFAGFSVIANNA